jgi:hypothetical protein
MDCVLCGVGTGTLCMIQMHFWLSSQWVSHRSFTAEPVLEPRSVHMRIVMKWHWDRFFSQFFGFIPVNIMPTNSPYSSSMCCFYQKDKWEKPGNLQTKHCSFGYQERIEQKSNLVVEIRQFSLLWDVNCFHYRYTLKDQRLQLAIWIDLNWMLSGSLLCRSMVDCTEQETGAMFSVTGAFRYVAAATPCLRYEVTALRSRFVRLWQCDIKMGASILEVCAVPIKWHHIPGCHSFNDKFICLMILCFCKVCTDVVTRSHIYGACKTSVCLSEALVTNRSLKSKCNLSLPTLWCHTGAVAVFLHVFLPSALSKGEWVISCVVWCGVMWCSVSDQLHTLATLLSGRNPSAHWTGGSGGGS